MRIFVAGATGVLGIRIVPLLVARGDKVVGMTRRAEAAATLTALGAGALVCDVYDAPRLTAAVRDAMPDIILDELTDLHDDPARIVPGANARIRTEGTRNVLAAAAGIRVVTQSVAWPLGGAGQTAVEEHERLVLEAGGVVVRYGRLYGPGTYSERALPEAPRIHVNDAARRTLDALGALPRTVVTLTD